MSTSIYIARIAAIIYLSVGVGILINPSYFRKIVDDFVKSPGASYLASILALIVGFVMVTAHNVWVFDWTLLITLLGWGAVIKGFLGLILPEYFLALSQRANKIKSFVSLGIVSLVLGVVLGYFGFLLA